MTINENETQHEQNDERTAKPIVTETLWDSDLRNHCREKEVEPSVDPL